MFWCQFIIRRLIFQAASISVGIVVSVFSPERSGPVIIIYNRKKACEERNSFHKPKNQQMVIFLMPLAATNNRISDLCSGRTLSKRCSSCVIHSAKRSFSFMTGSWLILSVSIFLASSPPERCGTSSVTAEGVCERNGDSNAFSKKPESSETSKESNPQSLNIASKSVLSAAVDISGCVKGSDWPVSLFVSLLPEKVSLLSKEATCALSVLPSSGMIACGLWRLLDLRDCN